MLTACWSVKGGSGTTVVSATLALLLARTSPSGALAVDLAGDLPTVLGMREPGGLGARDWLEAGPDVSDDALTRLAVDAGCGLRVVPRGTAAVGGDGADGDRLALALAGPGPTVVDCGSQLDDAALAVAAAAPLSLLVLRPCYLALRRAVAAPIRPSAVVLVGEPGRSLGASDVEDVLGVPVRVQIPYDIAIARAVDAGVLGSRLPRALERALRLAA